MQTVNNNFTVEALVAKYRNFVDEHCPKSSESDGVHEFLSPCNADVEEQLLITLYQKVAGVNADQRILEALSKYAVDFYHNAFNEREMAFLVNHFAETSTFIFDNLGKLSFWNKFQMLHESPTPEIRKFLATINIEQGSTIFLANSGYCDIAMLFPNCTIKGYTQDGFYRDKEMWALGQIRLFAAGIKSEIRPFCEDTENSQYMSDVDVAIIGTADRFSLPFSNESERFFPYMKPNCEFLLFLDKQNAAGNSMAGLAKMLVEKKCIYSIVSFEETNAIFGTNMTKTTICVRANKAVSNIVCIKNDATDDLIQLSANMLDPTILWPSYYLTAKPKEGIALSEIVSFLDLKPKNKEDIVFKKITFNDEKDGIEWILSDKEKTISVIAPINLSTGYEDAELYETQLKQAGDPMFEDYLGMLSKISQPCIFCYGRKDKFVAGYIKELPSEGIVAYRQLVCLVPKEGIDVRYVAALLLTPEVRNQIMSICEGEVDAQLFPLIMDKIIVPNHSDLERATFLSEANYKAIGSSKKKMEDRLNEKKAEYINEVRMRKHDMRPYLRQMASSERLMLHYLDNINDIEDLRKLLKKQISTSHNALQSLSELVEHLSNEERFGEPESVNLNDYFHNIEKNSEVNFTIKVSCEKALAQRKKEIEELKEKNKKENVPSMQGMDEKSITECSLDVYIAPVDLDRIVNNIIENARRHGGLSDGRKTDYYISIDVKIDYQRDMYQIDFSNNGKPLPKGMTKERYGLKGEKAGPNAGTGSGGYIVKSIVEHYGGDFDLFSTDGITTIRIYLPKYL